MNYFALITHPQECLTCDQCALIPPLPTACLFSILSHKFTISSVNMSIPSSKKKSL